ncbi:MAG: hypothetical protein AAGI52_07865 [Bacteroidota bacterium]
MRRSLFALATLLVTASPALAQSSATEQIPYQARLTDAAGDPVPDGPQTVAFVLADAAGGTWTETATVQTVGGVFTHYLGSVATIAGIDFADAPTLTVTLDPSGTPRTFGPVPLGAVPTAYRAIEGDGGTLTLPFSGRLDVPTDVFGYTTARASIGRTYNRFGVGLSVAFRADSASFGFVADSVSAALYADRTSGSAVYINDAGADGVRVINAGSDGVFVNTAGDDGFRIDIAGANGVRVGSAGEDGVRVSSAGEDGVRIGSAGEDGVFVDYASNNGIRIRTSDQNGIDVFRAGLDGVFVDYTGGNGVWVSRTAGDGLLIGTSGDTDGDGRPDVSRSGVQVDDAGGDGVKVVGAREHGIEATGSDGNYLRSNGFSVADLVLGAIDASSTGDDGILASDPSYSSSDLLLRSQDNVDVFIDVAGGNLSEFRVFNRLGLPVFRVDNSGVTSLTGPALVGEAAAHLDDPTAPEARTLTLPAAISDERLVAFSGNVVTDASGSASVTLPAYAEALAGDFRYQLTAIGSFAQAIVGEKMTGGRFTIRTSEPGVEVSWRVEGVRQDAWARTNAREAVAQKAQPGRYVHPEAFGLDASLAIALEADGPSELTAEGRARLAAEAAEREAREAERLQREQEVAEEEARREAQRRSNR